MTARKKVSAETTLGELIEALGTSGLDLEIRHEAGSITIQEAPRKPFPPAVAAAYASLRGQTHAARRVARAAELTSAGRTANDIGRIVAAEEGRERAYPARTVRAWRRRSRTEKP